MIYNIEDTAMGCSEGNAKHAEWMMNGSYYEFYNRVAMKHRYAEAQRKAFEEAKKK
jgi:hypothetical protein